LQTVPAREQENDNPNLAKTAGFSLHAGVAAEARQPRKLERLCRYDVQEVQVSREAGSRERSSPVRPWPPTDWPSRHREMFNMT